MSEVEQAVEQTQITEATLEKKEKVVRNIPGEDGVVRDFGARANVLTNSDIEAGKITFAIADGKVIDWVISGIEAFSEIQKKVFFYGLVSKVKTSLINIKEVSEISKTISKVIENIENGIFTTREAGEVLELTDLQKAWAYVASHPKAYKFAFVEAQQDFSNIDDAGVIAEVVSIWETFDRTKKNGFRKNPFILSKLRELEAERLQKEMEAMLSEDVEAE